MDWVIIILYGEDLKFDDFQFSYQGNSSPSLCSWIALETISMYLRNGSEVYGCLMDCTKAVDTVQHSLLFKKMLDMKIPMIIVRLLIYIYRNQTADVRWNGIFSKEFTMKNGVRQGAVLSPVLYCFYMNNYSKL